MSDGARISGLSSNPAQRGEPCEHALRATNASWSAWRANGRSQVWQACSLRACSVHVDTLTRRDCRRPTLPCSSLRLLSSTAITSATGRSLIGCSAAGQNQRAVPRAANALSKTLLS